MKSVGIEAMNVYGGTAYIDVIELMKHRNLDVRRVENLLMKEKSVALTYEDPVTYAVNAAKPLVDSLSEEEKNSIELVITATESGIDFGKSLSTYVHDHLGLNRNCRLFEVKQACYSGTAAMQMAISYVLSQVRPGAKALVIATDIFRVILPEDFFEQQAAKPAGEQGEHAEGSFAEPSSGAGGVAILISDTPKIFQFDVGANGYYGYQVMDTCRPFPDGDVGDADLSLMSYLDCCENAYRDYEKHVSDVDYQETFQYLTFHVPFGGMVKGAHRTMMRKFKKAGKFEIEDDFNQRVMPGLQIGQRVGNIMGGSVLMSLASTILYGDFSSPKRLGIFSYGSGCCSEFYSGVVLPGAQQTLAKSGILEHLDGRVRMNMTDYDQLMFDANAVRFGTQNVTLDTLSHPIIQQLNDGRPRLFLHKIDEFKREYVWTQA